MTLELQVALLGIVIAVVIGVWQIHLARLQVRSSQAAPTAHRHPDPAANGENLLHRLWGSFDPELQQALAVAYNQAKREGKTRISTRTFFAAVARLRPGQFHQFLDRLPEAALPEAVSEDVSGENTLLREDPQLSACVENALVRLGRKADPRHKLTTAEVFIDVAKHGTGPAAAHLRARGATPERIDEIVEELGWEVRER